MHDGIAYGPTYVHVRTYVGTYGHDVITKFSELHGLLPFSLTNGCSASGLRPLELRYQVKIDRGYYLCTVHVYQFIILLLYFGAGGGGVGLIFQILTCFTFYTQQVFYERLHGNSLTLQLLKLSCYIRLITLLCYLSSAVMF